MDKGVEKFSKRFADEGERWWLSPDSYQSPMTPVQYAVIAVVSPVRKVHHPVAYLNGSRCCVTCNDSNGKPDLWPCRTGKTIYSERELEEMGKWVKDPDRPHTPRRLL